jgi:hypothetical protein
VIAGDVKISVSDVEATLGDVRMMPSAAITPVRSERRDIDHIDAR